jgi:hypothetical protein
LQIKIKIVSCHTADSKPVKQEVNGSVMLHCLALPGQLLHEGVWLAVVVQVEEELAHLFRILFVGAANLKIGFRIEIAKGYWSIIQQIQ